MTAPARTAERPVDELPATRAPRAPARRDRTPLLIGAGALLLAVVVGGFLLGRAGGDTEEAVPAASNVNTAGALELSYPDGWERTDEPPDIPGLSVRNPIALRETDRPRDALVAGTTGAGGPALLPAAFLDRLDEPPARDDAVELGGLVMYRYRDLRPEGFNGGLTVYVAPTTVGVATVACTATAPGASTFLPACEEVANGLDLIRGKAFPLGAAKSYQAKVGQTFGRLNSARTRQARQLRGAKTRVAQANAARSFAGSYRRALRSLSGLSVSPVVRPASISVRTALAKTEAAYERLAAAARSGSQQRYDAARRSVQAGEAAVERALRRVQAASAG